jgi:ribosomal protein L2
MAGGCVGWRWLGLVLMRSCFLVAAQEGDAHPLGALPVGTLINNVESEPGRGAQYIRAAGMGTKATHIPQLG